MRSSARRMLAWAVAIVLAAGLVVWGIPLLRQREVAAQPREVSARGDLLPQEQTTIALFETAKPSVVVVPQLIARGKYVRPALGVEVDERLNQLVTERAGVAGVVVLRVTPGSAAETAGLRGVRTEAGRMVPGDIIIAVEGTAVDSVARLLSRLDDHRIGETVRLTLLRDGQKTDINVTLQAAGQ